MQKISFALFLMIVLTLGFTACVEQPKYGENVEVTVDTKPLEVYRGIVIGEVEVSGDWARVRVATAKDNDDISWELDVIIHSEAFQGSFLEEMKNLKIGKELLFRESHVSARNNYSTNSGSGYSRIGLFKGWPELMGKGIFTILNPPKK